MSLIDKNLPISTTFANAALTSDAVKHSASESDIGHHLIAEGDTPASTVSEGLTIQAESGISEEAEAPAESSSSIPTPEDLVFDLDDEDFDELVDSAALSVFQDAIVARCEAAKIEYVLETVAERKVLVISLPAGKSKRRISIGSLERAREFANSEFESFVFLDNYEAICSYSDGYIEAAVGSLGPGPGLMRMRRIFTGSHQEQNLDANAVIEIQNPNANSTLRLRLHFRLQRLTPLSSLFGAERRPCLIIEDVTAKTNDAAISLLETLSNSLFFELDAKFNVSLGLLKSRRLPTAMSGSTGNSRGSGDRQINFPTSKYDHEPISLYWYARSAAGMPLLRFLAFYQSVEFYFPIFAQDQAIKRARILLKDPRFDVHEDKDVIRLLGLIQVSRSGGLGDERSQLKATIEACLDADEMRVYLTMNEVRSNYYTDPKCWKPVSTIQIPLRDEKADLRTAVAERIYNIRCRIVHAKADGGQTKDEVLLPFSKEADELGIDIDLIQHVARQVLIATSKGLTI